MIPCLSPNGESYLSLASAPQDLLIGTTNGIVHVRRDGRSWRQAGGHLEGRHIGAIVNAGGGRILAGCHAGGLFRSLDQGAHWDPVGEKIGATHIFSLAILNSRSGSAILAGVEPVNLYRSDDGGDSWSEWPAIAGLPGAELWTFPPPPHIPHVKSITVHPTEPDTFFACVEQGALLKTRDAGRSWVELDTMWRTDDNAYRDAHRILVAPWNPDLLVFAAGIGVFRSTDGGVTWSARSADLAEWNHYPDVLAASLRDRAIYVGGPMDVPGNWPGGNPTGTISRSVDEGATWQALAVGAGEPANFEALTVVDDPSGYTIFAGDTMGRIFASDNAGASWQEIFQTAPVSKGSHYRLAEMAVRLPRWAGALLTWFFHRVTSVTRKRAAVRRKAELRSKAQAR